MWTEYYPCIACTVRLVKTSHMRIFDQLIIRRWRNGKDENLIGNTFACRRLEVLLAGFAQGLFNLPWVICEHDPNDDDLSAAASAYNHTLEPLDKRVSKYIGGVPIRVDGKPRASGVMDTVRAFNLMHVIGELRSMFSQDTRCHCSRHQSSIGIWGEECRGCYCESLLLRLKKAPFLDYIFIFQEQAVVAEWFSGEIFPFTTAWGYSLKQSSVYLF